MSYVRGESTTPLVGLTVGQMLERTTARILEREAFVSLHQNIRITFQQLLQQASYICKRDHFGYCSLANG